ncbi:thiamine pyrophosphate-binding protein [Streptomyces cupreus]|uniref:CBS domain-containing protein n=1 Tax=Streptomyces cupreus TaxID=2759956 RepID=A0A7X1JDU3_9ACTN|nr:hypothetical protein [Streptomyces cupreus]
MSSAVIILSPARRYDLGQFQGDKEAVFMAGGANRRSPDGTAAIVHGARGLTNALGAVADVRRSEVPVLCLVGMASTGSAAFLPPHAEFGLIPAAGAFASAFHDCSGMTEPDARIFLDTVNAAFAALDDRPAGPVLLGVPQDVLSARFVPPADLAAAPAEDRGLAAVIDEPHADRLSRALQGRTVADCLPVARPFLPAADPDWTAPELAELMARSRSPLIPVVSRPAREPARLLGVVTAARLPERLLEAV